MKKYLLAIIICFILAVLITGALIKPITPILFSGKTFENRSSSMQSLMITASILTLSFILFLLYYLSKKTFLRNQSIEKLIIRFSPMAERIEKSKIINILMIVPLIFIPCTLFFVQMKLITFPYQLEYGEGSIQLTTYALMNKINPFSIENNFLYSNVYGIGYQLVVFPFVLILGNTLTTHRMASFFCIIGTLILVTRVMSQKKNSRATTILAVFFVWLGLLFNVTPTARPDSLGEFLFLLTIFLPFVNKFNDKSLLVSAFIGIFSFYTKMYFFLGVPIIASYLFLFKSKKKGLSYGVGALIGSLISVLIINQVLETYILNTLFPLFSGRTNFNFFHFVKSLTKFIRDYWGLLAIGLILINQAINDWKRRALVVDLRHLDQPLFKMDVDLILYCLIICAFVIFLRMGWHTGTYQTYYYHLLTVFLVITILSHFENIKNFRIAFILIGLLTLCSQSFENLYPDFSNFDVVDWKKMEGYVIQSENYLNSPMEVSILISANKEIEYSFFSFYYFLLPEKNSHFWPDPKIMRELGENRVDRVANSIRSGKYDIVVRNANRKYGFFVGRLDSEVSNENFLEQYYRPIDNIMITMPHTMEEWDLMIMAPN